MGAAFSNGFFVSPQTFYWEAALIGNIFFNFCSFSFSEGLG
jgi:hypothetical protein